MDNPARVIYPWQQTLWATLTERFPNIGHGLLFYGKSGCGKHAFVEAFVAWVLCNNKQAQSACGQCSSCVWLKSDTHPNYVYVSTDEDNKKHNAKIKIEKIRELLPFVQQTVDGWRVIVIDPAEALNIASSNALLKTLEEPGERVMIILMAEHFLKLPATIRSRMQHFALDRIDSKIAHEYLLTQISTEQQQHVDLLLGLSNQMPLKAVELLNSAWFVQRQSFVQDWQKLVVNKNMPMLLATKWNKELNTVDFLQMFEYLLADILALKMQQWVKNSDIDLSVLAEQYSLENLFTLYDQLIQAKLLLQQNVQSNLIIDELFVTLMNVS
ncbi:AAA family ATPase [Acinetobacter rudis]|uniref:DNA-directed DNA polymerase n=1 Tax=Acinetobacter rudis CIP 110305 TaxID=421052 RepID=S3NJ09_9GAMM|nr:AAA family ATPase [Acinetobacter rudis]EPF74299.1 DNA polymerase III, delta' subunit [Acinetobacter rudis CIP 110305]